MSIDTKEVEQFLSSAARQAPLRQDSGDTGEEKDGVRATLDEFAQRIDETAKSQFETVRVQKALAQQLSEITETQRILNNDLKEQKVLIDGVRAVTFFGFVVVVIMVAQMLIDAYDQRNTQIQSFESRLDAIYLTQKPTQVPVPSSAAKGN